MANPNYLQLPKISPHNGEYTLLPDHCHSVSPEKLFVMVHESDKRVIQQKVDDADIKDAVVIIPTLANVMAYDNLWEGITCQRERLVLGDCLFLRSQSVGGLNVCLLATGGCNEVNFPCPLSNLSLGILLIAVDDTDVNGAFTDQEFIVNDILHDMRHFLLAEADTGVSQPNILTVVFVGIVKIAFALDIPAFTLGKQKRICQMIHIGFHCVQGNHIFTAAFLHGIDGSCHLRWIGQRTDRRTQQIKNSG